MDTDAPERPAYIGVGSNLEPFSHITRALDLLRARLTVTAVSPFYRSPAVGSGPQPDFVNGVLAVSTALPARELKFGLLRDVETRLGRRRSADKNAARTIDLDLVLYGGLRLEEPDLVVPDPGLRRYAFVALPLLALAPDIRMPGTGEKLSDLFPGPPERYGLEYLPEFSRALSAGG